MTREKFLSVDQYLQSFEGITKNRLILIRKIIKNTLPTAVEKISYNIPAYFVGKKMIIYFAGYDKHVSVYPIQGEDQQQLMSKFLSGKATAKFSNSEELPIELIRELVELRKS